MYGKLDQKPLATEFIDARGEVTTVVLLNAHSIKIFLNVCDYTHRLLLSLTQPEKFGLQWLAICSVARLAPLGIVKARQKKGRLQLRVSLSFLHLSMDNWSKC